MTAARFKVPLQTEVAAYMKERKSWPDEFCRYYAEKFWSFYQSNGWKVSGKAAMKDWKCAFNSNWQNLKWKEDIDYFNKCGGSTAKVVPMHPQKEMTDIERLDKLLDKYSKNPTSYGVSDLLKWNMAALKKCYDVIRSNRLWDPSITKQEVGQWEHDEWLLKANVIHRTLNYYGIKGWLFSQTIELRNKLAK